MAINKIDLSQINETLSAAFSARGFQLQSLADDSSMILEGGGIEEIGSYLYRVEGATTPADATSANGDRYLYVYDSGTGTATAEILTNAPVWNSALGGFYYNNKKAVYYTFKLSGTYTRKQKVGYLLGVS